MSEQAVIDMQNVGLRRDGRCILTDITWTVPEGGHCALVGANGSGKTTLLRIASGTLFPTTGTVRVLGKKFGETDLALLRKRIGWVSSMLADKLPPYQTAREIVLSGRKATWGFLGVETMPEDEERAAQCLNFVGLGDRANASFGILSQGERQKVLFARALTGNPELLILDEVYSGLDLSARESVMATIGKIARSGEATIILVTHHIEEIPPEVNRALVLKDGKVFADGLADQSLSSEVLSGAFGVGLEVECRAGRRWARTG